MGFIFNRPHIDYEIYEASLTVWEKSTDEYKRAMAINLRRDYRVTDKREQHFRNCFEDNGRNLEDALNNYYKDFVENPKTQPQPDFCDSANLIADCTSGKCCDGFNFGDELVTVLNLNALRRSLKDANNKLPKGILPLWEKLRTYKIGVALPDDILFSQWLNERLMHDGKTKKGNDPDVLEVIYAFFEILEYDLDKRPDVYKFPVWVSKWDLFEKVAFAKKYNGDDYVDRWNQVVGVNRRFPTWQIIVKYPTNAVKCLYRPSQLDGGIYPQHFPPPPLPPDSKFSLANGGHTVDLASKNSKLLPELLHQPIILKPEYYQGMIGKTKINRYKVRKPREQHYKHLSNIYYDNPDDIKKWMPTAI